MARSRYGLPFQGYHQRREAEWVGALVLMGVAIALLLPGATFSRPTFGAFSDIAPEGTSSRTPPLTGETAARKVH